MKNVSEMNAGERYLDNLSECVVSIALKNMVTKTPHFSVDKEVFESFQRLPKSVQLVLWSAMLKNIKEMLQEAIMEQDTEECLDNLLRSYNDIKEN